MAKINYTALKENLSTISNEPSDSGNRRGYSRARTFIMESNLSEADKKIVRAELYRGADTNQGYFYNSNGVNAAILAVSSLQNANDDSYQPKLPTPLGIAQFAEMVEDGRIFGVSFTKRTTGQLRTMSCRLGVKKFIRGGKMAYSPSEKQLLTVFDMAKKGYRSIPLDGIQSISVGGEKFSIRGLV